MSTRSSLLNVVCDLHEEGHLLRLNFRTREFESLFAEKLLIDEVVQWPVFFEELFVVRKVNCREDPFEKVAPSEFLQCLSQTLLLLLVSTSVS